MKTETAAVRAAKKIHARDTKQPPHVTPGWNDSYDYVRCESCKGHGCDGCNGFGMFKQGKLL